MNDPAGQFGIVLIHEADRCICPSPRDIWRLRAFFHTGWFIESIATQVLVIFLIRTRGKAYMSRPHPLLALTSLAVVLIAVAIPFTPLREWLGFEVPSVSLLVTIALLAASYLTIMELVKLWFFRRHPT